MSTKIALVVRGGWEGHEPVAASDLFLPFLENSGYTVRVSDSTEVYADEQYMATVDVIVQCITMSTIERDELAGLLGAVRRGTGLVGWHGGIVDSFRSSSDYLLLTGGQFAHHPPRVGPDDQVAEDPTANFLPHTINFLPEHRGHPIVAGLDDFELVTEQYWVLTDAYNEVLATTTLAAHNFNAWHTPVTCPAVWTRAWGDGQVVVATPGHSVEVLEHPTVRTLIERGILWATRRAPGPYRE